MRYPNKEPRLPTKLKKVFDGPMKTAVTIDDFEQLGAAGFKWTGFALPERATLVVENARCFVSVISPTRFATIKPRDVDSSSVIPLPGCGTGI
eukprot:scaffold625_cov324-Pavlova_lutheri.AAC.54